MSCETYHNIFLPMLLDNNWIRYKENEIVEYDVVNKTLTVDTFLDYLCIETQFKERGVEL